MADAPQTRRTAAVIAASMPPERPRTTDEAPLRRTKSRVPSTMACQTWASLASGGALSGIGRGLRRAGGRAWTVRAGPVMGRGGPSGTSST